jgi:hypothetical protein
MGNAYKIVFENLEVSDCLEDLVIDGRKILKWMSGELEWRMWI